MAKVLLKNHRLSQRYACLNIMRYLPSYPIWLNDGKTAWVIQAETDFDEATGAYIATGKLNSLKGFDSNLNRIIVAGYEVIGRAGLWGWKPGFVGIYYKIKINYTCIEQANIEQLKFELINFVSRNYSYYSSAWNLDKLVNKINDSDDIEKLLALI